VGARHLKIMTRSISVCIPTYNGDLFIEEQLLSILCQLGIDDEIIISDDHSTDSTLQKIAGLKDPRIKIFTNNGKPGTVYNMENALKQAKGELIFLADQDDIWYPEKIAVMSALLEKYDLVLSDATVIDQNKSLIHSSFFIVNRSGRGLFRNWYRNSFIGCCMAFNRKLLNYVLPFPSGLAMHDSWIGLNAALVGKYYFLPQPLIYYRRHGKNATAVDEKSGFSVLYMIRYRMHMMYRVLLRRIKYRPGSSKQQTGGKHISQ
jgi:glycosyltransferase involved in cell wall biosynthesis